MKDPLAGYWHDNSEWRASAVEVPGTLVPFSALIGQPPPDDDLDTSPDDPAVKPRSGT